MDNYLVKSRMMPRSARTVPLSNLCPGTCHEVPKLLLHILPLSWHVSWSAQTVPSYLTFILTCVMKCPNCSFISFLYPGACHKVAKLFLHILPLSWHVSWSAQTVPSYLTFIPAHVIKVAKLFLHILPLSRRMPLSAQIVPSYLTFILANAMKCPICSFISYLYPGTCH